MSKLARALALGSLLALTACHESSGGNGGGGGAPPVLFTVLQDLTVDPTGHTTELVFPIPVPPMLTPGNFEADGGQLATSVLVIGSRVLVAWDERVSPSHLVRAIAIPGVSDLFVSVASSDPAPPTFTVTAAAQNTPDTLGGDTLTVQFAGAHVLDNCVVDPLNWDLFVRGQSLDLAGTLIAFEPLLQRATFTLGSEANLHADFELAATGLLSVADVALDPAPLAAVVTSADTTPPVLLSAEQNLAESEFGFVVDFAFDKAMDPVFSTTGASFDAGFPVFATQIDQPTPDLLRVTFNDPIVPGLDAIGLLGIVDLHGNAFPDVPSQAIAAGSLVANAFVADPVVTTVSNQGGDTIVASFVQAVDPESAEEFGRWSFESPTGNTVDLSRAVFDYDFLAKRLTVTLVQDLQTADDFSFGPSGSTPPVDVDGEDFAAVFAGSIVGDASGPGVLSVLQNRTLDPSGRTYEVRLSEDVDVVAAEDPGNYRPSSGAVVAVTLLPGLDEVRIQLDALAVPGADTLDVEDLVDLAGNVMGVLPGNVIASTDVVPPFPQSATATTVAGFSNDSVLLAFDDDMIEAEAEDLANWWLEAPLGTVLDLGTSTVDYDVIAREARLTLGGIELENGDDFLVVLSRMRDLGGNAVVALPSGGAVDGEREFPALESVWVEAADPQKVHVRFSEPCKLFADALTTYVVRDPGGLDVGGGTPTITPDADGLGATVGYALGVVPGFHTLDVRGITDLAGNQMFPELAFAIDAEDATDPILEPFQQSYEAVAGEENDVLQVTFATRVSTWLLQDPANYDLTNGSDAFQFASASFGFDGDRALSVTFDGLSALGFDNGAYTLTVDGLLSAQGRPLVMASVETALAGPGTDAGPPALVPNRTRLDAQAPTSSLLVDLDEALDPVTAADTSSFLLDGTTNPDTSVQLGRRTVRLTFNGGVSLGQNLDVTLTDLAGNTGLSSIAVGAADIAGPSIVSVEGVSTAGVGGDRLEIRFSEPVTATALGDSNYTVTAGGQVLDLVGASARYTSTLDAVVFHLEDGMELKTGDALNVQASGIQNHGGLTMSPPADVNGSITGDAVAPGFRDAFANYRVDAGGLTLDARFDEAVDVAFAGDPASYVLTGGQVVLSATLLRPDTVRLSLSAPLAPGDLLQTSVALDLAGNAAATLDVEPVL